MGCNFSDQTKLEFKSEIYKQAVVIQELLVKKEEFLQIINARPKKKLFIANIKMQKKEFYPKIITIEENIKNLQSKINDSKQHTNSPELHFKETKIEIPKEENENDKDCNIPRSRKRKFRSNSSHILDDPSIKSIIENKKKLLEKRK